MTPPLDPRVRVERRLLPRRRLGLERRIAERRYQSKAVDEERRSLAPRRHHPRRGVWDGRRGLEAGYDRTMRE